MDHFADAHPARWGLRLQTRGNVHAVAVNAAVGLLEQLAQVNTDAESQSRLVGSGFVAIGQRPLHRQGGLHGAGCEVENCQHRIARHVDDVPAPRANLVPEDLARGIECHNGG